MRIKKVVTFILGAVCALSVMACGNDKSTMTTIDVEKAGTEEDVQIANPWSTCDTLDEACKIAGFDIKVPETLDGYDGRDISVLNQEIIQVCYGQLEDGSWRIDFRKGKDADVSGDYNEYNDVEEVQIDGMTVTLKGNDGTFKTAVWQKDGYGYSIFSNDELERDVMMEYVRQMQ